MFQFMRLKNAPAFEENLKYMSKNRSSDEENVSFCVLVCWKNDKKILELSLRNMEKVC